MEVQYIISITAGGLFAILFLLGIIFFFYNRAKQKQLNDAIYKMYCSEDLRKMDFEYATCYEASSRPASSSRAEGQVTIEEVLFDATANVADEGLEEITGNYNPD